MIETDRPGSSFSLIQGHPLLIQTHYCRALHRMTKQQMYQLGRTAMTIGLQYHWQGIRG
jgi:hypothetical protein